MALPTPVTGETVEATDVTYIKDHLEGAVGSTAPWHFRQSSGHHTVTLSTNDGTTKVSFKDSDGVEVFAVDSNGNITLSGSVSAGTFTFPTSATPSQTTEGGAYWDTDDDNLTVGDGTSRRRFDPDNKGSDLASATTVTLANDHYYHITGTTTITALSTKASGYTVFLEFDSPLTLTHNATSFILNGSVSRTLQAKDTAVFVSEGSGNWREISSGRADLSSMIRGFVSDGAYQALWFCTLSGMTITSADDDALAGVGTSFIVDAGATGTDAPTTGMFAFSTGTTNNTDVGLYAAAIPANRGFQVGCRAVFNSAASQSVIIGAVNGQIDTDNDAIAWRVNGTGNIIGYCDSGGVETTRDTSVVPDGSTIHRLVVTRVGNTVQFFRNGVQVGADVTTNLSSAAMHARVNLRTLTTVNKSMQFQDFSGMVAAA